MYSKLRHFLELIRFSHTVFALPFALLSAVLAWSTPGSDFRWRDLVGILVCMVTARSAAMAFNRLVDRGIDADNPRTAKRHLPAGILSVRSVTIFTVVMGLAFLASTTLFLPKTLPMILAVPHPAVSAGVLARQTLDQPVSLLAVGGVNAVTDCGMDRCQG
jgi:4-hydroxybenzoate polyprenyltransferase